MFASLNFFLQEALSNCRRAGMMTLVTLSTIAVALLLMGVFLLASLNIESFLSRLQDEAMVTAFLQPTASREQANSLKLKITEFEEVNDIQLITPEMAARELFSNPDDRNLLNIGIASGTNPLPTTLRLKIRSSHDLETLLKKLKGQLLVESVSYGEEAFRQFQGLSELFWIGSLIIIILLGLSSLFIVFNTVRLTLILRRDEIVIMKLVGATNWFIRWPFIIEGVIQGILGAVLAVVLLIVSYKFIMVRLAVMVPFFTMDIGFSQVLKLSIKLLLMGILLGVSGSLLSLRDLDVFKRES